MEKQQLEKLEQLLKERYQRELSLKVLLIIIAAAAVSSFAIADEELVSSMFFCIAYVYQLFLGGRYRKELSLLRADFRKSYCLTYVLIVGFALVAVLPGVIELMPDGTAQNAMLLAVVALMAALGIVAFVRMLSYYSGMNRLAESILPDSGRGWRAQRKRAVQGFWIYLVALIVIWIVTVVLLVNAGWPHSDNTPAGAIWYVITYSFYIIAVLAFGLLLSSVALLIYNMVLRGKELACADEMLAIIKKLLADQAKTEAAAAEASENSSE